MNAAGFLGFAPDPRRMLWLDRFGAFITNPISLSPRSPARNSTVLPFGSGFILHTGFPNLGLDRIIRENAKLWAASAVPIILHLLIQDVQEIDICLAKVEALDGVSGVELSFYPEIDISQMIPRTSHLSSELPVIFQLTADQIYTNQTKIMSSPISAVSLARPRGAIKNCQSEIGKGRYLSHSNLPITLHDVDRLKGFGTPIFAGAGVTSEDEIPLVLEAGAAALQLDAVLWD